MESAERQKQPACNMCAQPSDSTICPTCEAKIRGELLDEKNRDEKAGHADSSRH